MPIITAANLGLEILSGMERSIAAGHLGPTNVKNREPREAVRQALGRMHGRTDDAAIRERIMAVLVKLAEADRAGGFLGRSERRASPPRKPRAQPVDGDGQDGYAGTREVIFATLEKRIAEGSIRGPRHRKLRREFIKNIGRYLERATDPDQRARLGAILGGLEEADKLPMPKVNPNVFSSAEAAQLIRTRKA